MLRQLKTKIICLVLGLSAISSFEIQGEIKREYIPYTGQPYVKVITTRLINKSKYKIKLLTQSESTQRLIAGNFIYWAVGPDEWLEPGKTIEITEENWARCCNSIIYFIKNDTDSPKSHSFKLKGESGDHAYTEFNIHVDAKPVNMYYSGGGIKGDKKWIYPFWDYTITVTDR